MTLSSTQKSAHIKINNSSAFSYQLLSAFWEHDEVYLQRNGMFGVRLLYFRGRNVAVEISKGLIRGGESQESSSFHLGPLSTSEAGKGEWERFPRVLLECLALWLCCPICCADLSARGSSRSVDGLFQDRDTVQWRELGLESFRAATMQRTLG